MSPERIYVSDPMLITDTTAYCPADVPCSGVSLNDSDTDDNCFTDLYQDYSSSPSIKSSSSSFA